MEGTTFPDYDAMQPLDPNKGVQMVKHNDDTGLHVEILPKEFKDEQASRENGYPIFKSKPYIKIHHPGGHDITFRALTEDDKARFPQHWAMYQQLGETATVGMPLEKFPGLTREEVEALKYHKIFSVEQLANSGETAIEKLGPKGPEWREAAKAYLEDAANTSLARKQAEEIASLREEIQLTRDQMKASVIAEVNEEVRKALSEDLLNEVREYKGRLSEARTREAEMQSRLDAALEEIEALKKKKKKSSKSKSKAKTKAKEAPDATDDSEEDII
jgi:hypothetical protein